MSRDVGPLYLEHLTAADLTLLGQAAEGAGQPGSPALLTSEPARVVGLLSHPSTHRAVLGRGGEEEPFLRASPFLTFAVAVHRAADELAHASFTTEWVGLRRTVPVFDVGQLRDFLADPLRRLFLVELLASYTHVASGSTWVHTRRGWRRRRFSELDPVRLASLLDVVGEAERPGVYRRLGDLALFLTGVFPDHTAARGLPPVDHARLLRSTGIGPPSPDPDDLLSDGVSRLGAVGVLEHLGERWYRLAASTAPGPLIATMQATADVAARFRQARRILNYVTDRFLFPFRSRWFGVTGP